MTTVYKLGNQKRYGFSEDDTIFLAVSKCGRFWARDVSTSPSLNGFIERIETESNWWMELNEKHPSQQWNIIRMDLAGYHRLGTACDWIEMVWVENYKNKDKKEKTMEKKTLMLSGAKAGAKQLAFDEAGEILLDVAKNVVGENNPMLATEQGREIAKVLAAYALVFIRENVDLGVRKQLFEDALHLQTQTAFVKLVGPHMKQLRELAVTFAGKLT